MGALLGVFAAMDHGSEVEKGKAQVSLQGAELKKCSEKEERTPLDPGGLVDLSCTLICSLVDTDECLGTPCQQRCKNSLGSYRCSCRTGFHLHGNRHSCVGKGRTP